MPAARLVTTPELAAALGLSARSIQRYVANGVLEPDVVSPGGHYRWDVERVREQLRAARRRDD